MSVCLFCGVNIFYSDHILFVRLFLSVGQSIRCITKNFCHGRKVLRIATFHENSLTDKVSWHAWCIKTTVSRKRLLLHVIFASVFVRIRTGWFQVLLILVRQNRHIIILRLRKYICRILQWGSHEMKRSVPQWQ